MQRLFFFFFFPLSAADINLQKAPTERHEGRHREDGRPESCRLKSSVSLKGHRISFNDKQQINNSTHVEMEGYTLNFQGESSPNLNSTPKICTDLLPADPSDCSVQLELMETAEKKTGLNPGVFVWTNVRYVTRSRLHEHTNRQTNTRLWLTTLLRVSEEKWKSLSPEIKAVVQIKRSNSSIRIGVCSHTNHFQRPAADRQVGKHQQHKVWPLQKTLERVWMLRFRNNTDDIKVLAVSSGSKRLTVAVTASTVWCDQ